MEEHHPEKGLTCSVLERNSQEIEAIYWRMATVALDPGKASQIPNGQDNSGRNETSGKVKKDNSRGTMKLEID